MAWCRFPPCLISRESTFLNTNTSTQKKNSHNSTAQKYKNLEKLYMSMIIIKDYYFAGFQSIRCNKTKTERETRMERTVLQPSVWIFLFSQFFCRFTRPKCRCLTSWEWDSTIKAERFSSNAVKIEKKDHFQEDKLVRSPATVFVML